MPNLEPIRAATEGRAPEELLRFLIEERFPGKIVVTASLRAPSIVVLKMVADIDPSTPVVFCRRGTPFPESAAYHDAIVSLLGLSNVTITAGHERQTRRGDYDHCEEMRVEYENCPGECHEIAHLNDTLAPYECWISAVYHVRRPAQARVRIDAEGRLCRVDALSGWSDQQVREYMERSGLPHHARAYRERIRMPPRGDSTPVETYNV
jgi:phosphoadenosine phosphosulfate reductase